MKRLEKKLPIGVDSFDALIRQDYYYLDKTEFISQLIRWHGAVNLFTRPRRFGKTLNMSMLKSFFEIGADQSLFRGLKISENFNLCEAYQSSYPVIFLSLKEVEGDSFKSACIRLKILVSNECKRLSYLLESRNVLEADKKLFRSLMEQEAEEYLVQDSLSVLMRMLHTHYGKQVILLIDEYDVPLEKASTNGYYDTMVNFLRGFFGSVFKTNADLYFAVVTGCLRISKESIFTGINNLKVDTISDERYDEYFGFTDKDVRRILADYELANAYGEMKEWYDGYHFGKADVYCPWDVINHCDALLQNPDTKPKLYWDNTSSNEMVKQFIELADFATRSEIEELIASHSIEKRLIENLTYGELREHKDYLWSVLYLTGYLTVDRSAAHPESGATALMIPNREVKEIFINKIQKWFSESVTASKSAQLYRALWDCNEKMLQQEIREILLDTISYYDYHENYYHALLVGLLVNGDVKVRSNYENGSGRSDIAIEDDRKKRAAIIEIKHCRDYDDLEKDCMKALRQIEAKKYAWQYQRKGYAVLTYGMAFAGKDCFVKGKKIHVC